MWRGLTIQLFSLKLLPGKKKFAKEALFLSLMKLKLENKMWRK